MAVQPLVPVEAEDVSDLVKTCDRDSLLDYRDKALLMILLDTGARAREDLHIDIHDVDLASGVKLTERGKGGKLHTVFLGKPAGKP